MVKMIQNEYKPDYAVPPGETLQEILDELPMTQAELARRIGRTPKMINEIIAGKAPLTPETALLLERVLGVPARLWNKLERNYQEDLARLAEQDYLAAQIGWLDQVPVQAMTSLGWITLLEDPIAQLREVLQFFAIASPQEWQTLWMHPQAAFRQSPAFAANPMAVAAWLRKGELDAQQIACEPFDTSRFHAALDAIRALTITEPEHFQAEVVRLCAAAGVAVVFVPALPGTRASGATRWLTPDKALLQLSLRYKSDDQLWFTFFHEAGHLLRHGKREVFIDIENNDESEKEADADKFAANFLISPKQWRGFAQPDTHYSKDAIIAFATEQGIAPGIVVGRLQHEGYLDYKNCNGLKRRLDWTLVNGNAVVTQRQPRPT